MWLWAAQLAVLAALVGHAGDGRAASSCMLRHGWTPYAVYTYRDAQGSLTGADIELVRALAKEIGCETVFRELPWARILLEIENGTLDSTSSASATPERKAYAEFSDPHRQAEMGIYVRRGEASRYPLDQLVAIRDQPIKLGVVNGFFYSAEFESLMDDPRFAARVEGAADYAVNIRKLVHGRIDGFLVDDIGVMIGEARAMGVIDQVERHPLHLAGDDLRLMFSRKSVDPQIVADINASLAQMRADGRLQAIIDPFLK